jgi:hypothetical protein
MGLQTHFPRWIGLPGIALLESRLRSLRTLENLFLLLGRRLGF